MKFVKEYILLSLLLFSVFTGNGQMKKLSFAIRVPVQLEFQKVQVGNSPSGIQENTAVNFGINGIINRQINGRLSVYGGVGYFRERFKIKRFYDHIALNPDRPGFLVALYAFSYDYHLLTFPVAISFAIPKKTSSISFAAEYMPAFIFSASYNGSKPFPGANTRQQKFSFFSHEVNINADFPFTINSSHHFSCQPFIRLLQTYKKDPILYENENENVTRTLNAAGVCFIYHFNL